MKMQNYVLPAALIILGVLAAATWPARRAHARITAPGGVLSVSDGQAAGQSDSGNAVPQTADFLGSDPSRWSDMMPRRSFKGWTRVPIPPDKPLDPVSQWSIDQRDRTIVCAGNHGHEWLRYDREYANFILHVEWRFKKLEGPHPYNSGIFVRNDLTGRVWHQAQVGEKAYFFGQTLVHGAVSPMINMPGPEVNPLHPIGEWNTYEIRCDGPELVFWVNHSLAGEFKVPEVPKGYWGLEAEGYYIEFRNIKLKKLP